MDIDSLTQSIIGAAMEVHKMLGPGLLESAYEECLCHELNLRNLAYQRQYSVPVCYKDVNLDCGYRIDILVDERVVVELKAVEHLTNVHDAQLLSYLKSGGWRVGLIINFNVPILKQGIRRKVLNL